ncbi:MAG TPA: ABC transporter ATP-binding protein, partial [Anaerolineales bacterium]
MTDQYYEEEEFGTDFNGKTLLRIIAQTRPYWRWVGGFVAGIAVVVFLDSYFTYLGKRIIDEGIEARSQQAVLHIVLIYALIQLAQAAFVFTMIYLTGVLGERIRYDL